MSDLRIPLARVDHSGFAVDEEVSVESVQPSSAAPVPLKTVRLKGTLQDLEGDYLFRGRAWGHFDAPCDRCLTDRAFTVDVEVTWFFEPGEDLDLALQEENQRVFLGDSIDLGPYLWEELVLALPSKFTCEAADNQPPCAAESEDWVSGDAADETETAEGNNAFAQLKDMFPDLSAGRDKE
jgi:uncharacterized metal-binding protein YceD (DUF177 family)